MSMLKVGFYIENRGTLSVNCQDLKNGNPGIGGTEYSMLLVAENLTIHNFSNIHVSVYASSTNNISSVLTAYKVDSAKEAIYKASQDGVKILVIRFLTSYFETDLLDYARSNGIKIVIHAHNFFNRKNLNYFQKYDNVYIVNVGREQLEAYRDHSMYLRSTYIYNGLYFDDSLSSNAIKNDNSHEVVYVGSIIKEKGLHYLTQAWPIVLRAVPDAKLNVIGAGNLYNRNTKLGKYNIANEEYENHLLEPIIDSKGRILSSIKFWGNLGKEKKELIRKCKVGVPNPGGIGETFGYTAIEMQQEGCYVTTARVPGYMDTVYDKEMLYTNVKMLAANIITLLKRPYEESYHKQVKLFLKATFDINKLSCQWVQFFYDVESESIFHDKKESIRNISFQLKWLRESNRLIKKVFPFLPTIAFYEYFYIKVVRKILRLLNYDLNPIIQDKLERISS